MADRPETPADRRPNDEPFYIDSDCPSCGTELVLRDLHREPIDTIADVDWHDEWVCPDCDAGVYLDVPDDPF